MLYIVLPSLRTPAYTAVSLFHVVCSFILFAWIIAHFINHKELEDLFEIIGEINLCLISWRYSYYL